MEEEQEVSNGGPLVPTAELEDRSVDELEMIWACGGAMGCMTECNCGGW